MTKLTLKDVEVSNKKVLIRVDFNVPLNDDLSITDDYRIRCSLESIQYIIKNNGIVILMSHLGRPKGEKTPKLSLAPCAKRLSELLQKPVSMAFDCVGEEVRNMIGAMQPGQIILLENLRFHKEEENPTPDDHFAKELASYGDIYVNDAFGTAHRKHSSTYYITRYFPKASAMGFLMEKEIQFLTDLVQHPKLPFYAILGGVKISTKIGLISKLIEKVDSLFIGGAMALHFWKAHNISTGKSPIEQDKVAVAKETLELAANKNKKIYLPEDYVIAEKLEDQTDTKVITKDEGIPENWYGVDIGPATVKKWIDLLQKAATIFWNGPLGIQEIPSFMQGTANIAKTLANSPAITIAGGGDSVAAIRSLHLENKFTHVSTGGGASLEFIEKGSLPGVEALTNK